MVGLKVGLQYKGGSSNPVGVTIFLKTFVLGRFNKKIFFFKLQFKDGNDLNLGEGTWNFFLV